MNSFTKLAAVAATAISLGAIAAPSHATVFAQFSPLTNANYIHWVNNHSGNTGSGGTLSGTAATQIKFFDGPDANQWLDATFTLNASITNSPATYDAAHQTYTQSVGTAANPGTFSFIYSGPTTGTLTHGENLLSGSLVNAWIQGAGDQGGFAVTIGNTGSVTFTSAYEDFSHVVTASNGFTIDLALQRGQTITTSAPGVRALKSFNASAGGRFSDIVASVPEPGTWAMMLVGFGGMGALIRNRRRQGVFA